MCHAYLADVLVRARFSRVVLATTPHFGVGVEFGVDF
jgi:hypothetical protein